MPALLDIAGQKFGRLTAIERAGTDKHLKLHWRFRCDCGKETQRVGSTVVSGKVSSCGCLRSETAGITSRRTAQKRGDAIAKHGHARRGQLGPEYMIWASMIGRCTNTKNKAYPSYGGRGITVCAAWLDSFTAFLSDMGPRPGREYSIDRINNDGPYAPENCRWATRVEQKANQRPRKDAVYLTYNGETRTRDDWARLKGIKYGTLAERMRRGWPVERCLTP